MATFNRSKIFKISDERDFEKVALELFSIQSETNPIYKAFCSSILKGIKPTSIHDIPFLPIQFFKTHKVACGSFSPEVIYTSSGTTGSVNSKHFVAEKSWYLKVCKTAFEHFYGALKDTRVLALLPSYIEREGSSLIDMIEYFISENENNKGGFYLYNHNELAEQLLTPFSGQTLLIGVTYALLDFAEKYHIELPKTFVMETGGMKGKRKEIIRDEVHWQLNSAFSTQKIHSEYGMTELLSQAYSKGDGVFNSPPWMKVLVRQTTDPLSYVRHGKTGGINIIDLANVDSCAFIQTQDLGRSYEDNCFEVIGRFDDSDVRGCNLMVS